MKSTVVSGGSSVGVSGSGSKEGLVEVGSGRRRSGELREEVYDVELQSLKKLHSRVIYYFKENNCPNVLGFKYMRDVLLAAASGTYGMDADVRNDWVERILGCVDLEQWVDDGPKMRERELEMRARVSEYPITEEGVENSEDVFFELIYRKPAMKTLVILLGNGLLSAEESERAKSLLVKYVDRAVFEEIPCEKRLIPLVLLGLKCCVSKEHFSKYCDQMLGFFEIYDGKDKVHFLSWFCGIDEGLDLKVSNQMKGEDMDITKCPGYRYYTGEKALY